MKKILTVVLLMTSLSVFGQTTFAPSGATWYYTYYPDMGPYLGYTRIDCVGDTVINGIICKKLSKEFTTYFGNVIVEPPVYVYTIGDSVMMTFSNDSNFYVLYDFGAQPGESWETKYYHGVYIFNNDSTATITVDSIASIFLGTDTLRVLFTHSDNEALSFANSPIVERLGGMNYMFPQNYVIQDTHVSGGLRCYNDSTVFSYQTLSPCDTLIGLVGIEELTQNHITIFPNPAGNAVSISWNLQNIESIEIQNIFGQKVLTHQIVRNESQIELNIAALPTALYQVVLRNSQDSVTAKKLLKTN